MWKLIAFLPNAAKILLMRYNSHMTNTSTHLYSGRAHPSITSVIPIEPAKAKVTSLKQTHTLF